MSELVAPGHGVIDPEADDGPTTSDIRPYQGPADDSGAPARPAERDLAADAVRPPDLPARRRRRSARAQRIFRWLHVYTSMISLLVVLFFGATGITLNHPDWTFGMKAQHTTATGTLPAGYAPNGTPDLLVVTEFVRSTYGISAPVTDHQADAAQGSVSFAGPGYAAAVVFDVPTGAYTVTVDQQGLVGVLNDVHKGRNTGSSWKWVIDVAGGLLVFVALTGLGIQLFMRKNRRLALALALGGAALTVALIAVTTV